MLNVPTAEFIISKMAYLIAYVISITFAGFFTAWVALKLGDDTPEQEGFLTLNPLAHVDPLGTLFLMLYRFGWSRFVPINPLNMHGRFRIVKILIAYLTETFWFLILGILSLLALIALFGARIFAAGSILTAFPESSSYTLAIAFILIAMFGVNIMLAVVSFLVNMCGLGIMYLAEKNPSYLHYTNIIMVLVPLLFYFIFGSVLLNFVYNVIHQGGYLLATLLHLL